MNNQIYNKSSDPLYVTGIASNNLLSSNSNFYSVTISNFSLSIGGNYLVQLTNPPDSTKTLYLYKMSFSNSGANIGMSISLIKNGSFNQAGTSVTPVNTNFQSTATSSATVKHGNFSAIGSTVVLSTLQSSAIYTEFIDSIIGMPPNTTLLVQINNGLLSIQTVSVNIFWYEI